MTPTELTAVLGIVTQILFEYVPGFTTWYQPKTEVFKRLFMAGVLLAIAAGAVLGSCTLDLAWMACSNASIMETLWSVLAAAGIGVATNQGAHLVLKRA